MLEKGDYQYQQHRQPDQHVRPGGSYQSQRGTAPVSKHKRPSGQQVDKVADQQRHKDAKSSPDRLQVLSQGERQQQRRRSPDASTASLEERTESVLDLNAEQKKRFLSVLGAKTAKTGTRNPYRPRSSSCGSIAEYKEYWLGAAGRGVEVNVSGRGNYYSATAVVDAASRASWMPPTPNFARTRGFAICSSESSIGKLINLRLDNLLVCALRP